MSVRLHARLGLALRLRLETSSVIAFNRRTDARFIQHDALRAFAFEVSRNLSVTYSQWRGAWLVELVRSGSIAMMAVDGGFLWEGFVFGSGHLQYFVVRGLGVFAKNGEPLGGVRVRLNPAADAIAWWDALVAHPEGVGLKRALDAQQLNRLELAMLAALPGWAERPLLCELVPSVPMHTWARGVCLACGRRALG